jgi:PleD family two-component response regulator
VENLQIVHEGAPGRLMTLSIGVACVWPSAAGEHATAAALVEAADAALYVAKRSGRNAVVCAPRFTGSEALLAKAS